MPSELILDGPYLGVLAHQFLPLTGAGSRSHVGVLPALQGCGRRRRRRRRKRRAAVRLHPARQGEGGRWRKLLGVMSSKTTQKCMKDNVCLVKHVLGLSDRSIGWMEIFNI